MIKTTVRALGFDDVKRKLDNMRSDLADRAASAALNKVGDKASTEMIRAITDEYNISRAEVQPRLWMKRAKKDDLLVVLNPFASKTRGRSMNLIHFLEKKVTMAEARRRAKQGRLSVKTATGRELPILYFRIKRSGPAKPIPGTFIGNKGRTVFIRTGKSRLPIEAMSTIGVPQMFNTTRVKNRVLDRVRREMKVEFDRAIKMVMERYK